MVSDSLLFIYMEILFKNFTEKSLMVKFVREEKKKSKKVKKIKKIKNAKILVIRTTNIFVSCSLVCFVKLRVTLLIFFFNHFWENRKITLDLSEFDKKESKSEETIVFRHQHKLRTESWRHLYFLKGFSGGNICTKL